MKTARPLALPLPLLAALLAVYEGLPPELAEKMNEWKRGARDLGISAKLAKKHAAFEAWSEAWKDGLASYESVWKKWKGPTRR